MGGPDGRGRHRRGQHHPYAGGWNDGSRLATVESLVDHHTWVIDDSIFVNPSAGTADHPHRQAPCRADPAADYLLKHEGTLDKLFINGQYYSSKSPTPSSWLAAVYAAFRFCTGWTAATHAGAFCSSSDAGLVGLAYVVAVWSVWRLGRPLGLAPRCPAADGELRPSHRRVPYARHVNNHILLLGVVAALMTEMAQAHGAAATWGRMLRLGLLAGLSYTIDVGTGPLLLGGAAVWLLYRCRRPAPLAVFALAAAPWVLLHHGLNYMIGGTLGPANADPAYFDWPGSPFNAPTMTGGWRPGRLYLRPVRMQPGRQAGFSRPQPDAGAGRRRLPALRLCRRPSADRPEAVLAVVWCVGTWLLYSVTSTNHSGVCCSVRWFVPLLAPGFYILAIWLRDCSPAQRRNFVILSGWGAVLGA